MDSIVRPPGPKGAEVRRLVPRFRTDPVTVYLEFARQYGDIAYLKLGMHELYVLSNPDHVRDVWVDQERKFAKGPGFQSLQAFLGKGLLTSDGDLHRRQRQLLAPLFHSPRGHARVMLDKAAEMTRGWADGREIDVSREVWVLTLRTLARALFGVDLEDAAIGRVLDALEVGSELVDPQMPSAVLRESARFREAREAMDSTVRTIVAERRAAETFDQDVVSLLLRASDRGAVTDDQLRDELATLFQAGSEPTAGALSWACYALASHPEIQAAVQEEIDLMLADRAPTVDDPVHLPYLEQVFNETLRMYPPAWATERLVLSDHRVAGYTIPQGATILINQYAINHDARHFPDPDRFDPSRWSGRGGVDRRTRILLPFGAGRRRCIGASFAWTESLLVLATIARGWTLRLRPGYRVAYQARINLRPRGGVPVTVHRRS